MNQQSLDAIATNHPNQRQSYARMLAATCMLNYPGQRRASSIYVWAEVALYCAYNPAFGKWALKVRINGLRRFVLLTLDIWQYWKDAE
jgi:hypothetical protein